MDLFVEEIDGSFAVCRIPDREKHLIRLPLYQLPSDIKQFDVITLKDSGVIFKNNYAKEMRMIKIAKSLKCKKYHFEAKN